jgi:hypothetical protein
MQASRKRKLQETRLEDIMKNPVTQLRLASLLSLILLTWTAAHAQVTPSQDSFTNNADATTNYGANVLLDVNGAKEIAYIQFDLASIPSGASVSQATLKLYVNAVTTAGSFNVDYVNGSWEESTLDASNAPPLGASIASNVSITTADKNQYILINITPALEAWLNGSQPNDGVAIVANGTFSATFDSKESKTTSHPAELDVVLAGGSSGITGIETASGSGLIGGGTSGTLNLSLTNACAASQVLQWNGTLWICASVGTGTITGVTAGTDLTGGGTSGNVTLSLNMAATNALYAQLAANNTFSGTQTINNSMFVSGANSTGVLQVTNTLTSGTAPAVLGVTDSTGASGVKGVVAATSGTGQGVYGVTNSATGFGVRGMGLDASAVAAQFVGFAPAGVWGDTGYPDILSYGVLATSDFGSGLFVANNSDSSAAAIMFNVETSDSTALVLQTYSDKFGGLCTIDVSGNLSCTGKVSGVVTLQSGARKVALYAMQSPENWFEDAGSGQLYHGSAHVGLDPTFAQTVNAGVEYHVFLTPKGDSEGLYVSDETPEGFEVREQRGGHSNIAFDYRIMAKRVGYENVRLQDLTEQINNQQARLPKLRNPVRSSSAPQARPGDTNASIPGGR